MTNQPPSRWAEVWAAERREKKMVRVHGHVWSGICLKGMSRFALGEPVTFHHAPCTWRSPLFFNAVCALTLSVLSLQRMAALLSPFCLPSPLRQFRFLLCFGLFVCFVMVFIFWFRVSLCSCDCPELTMYTRLDLNSQRPCCLPLSPESWR